MNDLNVSSAEAAAPSPGPGRELQFGDAERRFVYAVGRRYVRDEAAADDVAQDAMLLAFRHRGSFRGESHPRTWLHRIAMMTALGYLRRKQRLDARVTGCDPAELAESSAAAVPSAASALETHELAEQLRRRLGELDEKYAAVLRLRAEDLRDQEIAARLGLTISAVKVRAHRARGMLRQVLAPELADAA